MTLETTTLRQPLPVTFEQVPDSIAVAYIGYQEPFGGGKTSRVSPNVNVDLGDTGEVLGIEIIDVTSASLAIAAQFAIHHALDFPRDLLGCAPSAPKAGE